MRVRMGVESVALVGNEACLRALWTVRTTSREGAREALAERQTSATLGDDNARSTGRWRARQTQGPPFGGPLAKRTDHLAAAQATYLNGEISSPYAWL